MVLFERYAYDTNPNTNALNKQSSNEPKHTLIHTQKDSTIATNVSNNYGVSFTCRVFCSPRRPNPTDAMPRSIFVAEPLASESTSI